MIGTKDLLFSFYGCHIVSLEGEQLKSYFH